MTYLDMSNIGELEKEYVMKALDSGYVSTAGPLVEEFEKAMADYLGVEDALATNSGTSALHLALIGCGIGPGDEVIIPDITFIATSNVVKYCNAKPVYAPITSDTWTLDPYELESYVTERTKAVIPVHLYGNPCDMDRILDVASKYNLYVIEDACESLGAFYKGFPTGTFGDFGCFSFNGNKVMTTGGGGLLIARDKQRLNHLKYKYIPAKSDNKIVTYNYRMINIAAALGLTQLQRLDDFVKFQRDAFDIYQRELSQFVTFQEEQFGSKSSRWFTAIKDPEINWIKGIIYRSGFMSLSGKDFTHYCLPRSTLNTLDDIYEVCKKIKEAIHAE